MSSASKDSAPGNKRKAEEDESEGGWHGLMKKSAIKTVPKQQQSFIFGLKNKVGVLREVMDLFKKHHVDMDHIESRPVVDSSTGADYEFFVSAANVDSEVVTLLKGMAVFVNALDDKGNSGDPKWFPRRIEELDVFATRVLNAGSELESDHPGFTDPVYRERRRYFADIAINYKHNEPIPKVDYTQEEIATWQTVYEKLTKLYPTHACKEFNRVFPLLEENCGYGPNQIPQLADVSTYLQKCTGFRLRPVAGLLSSRDFLAGLAFRVFHSTQYIRHKSKPLYTPEPDCCHELLGHVPLFADNEFAQFSQSIGLASLGASDEDIEKLATCYWFTIEFGLCKEGDGVKAYGAGLLSSFGELQYCLSGKPQIQPFRPEITGQTPYPVTEYQPLYFLSESFTDATTQMREYAAKLKRPFQIRYNPYTQSINLLESNKELSDLALEVKALTEVLAGAITRRVRK
eukprot:m.335395 g.335395  ORF g.335395 m.335395 type:complete len:459 (+) comp17588_c0_seq1:119-1495(+)